MISPEAISDFQMRMMNLMHRSVLTVSGGRLGHAVGDMEVVKLTTTGRRSGQPRTVLLTVPVHDGDNYVLVASKGGDDRHPDWYRNLVANPDITLEPAGGGPAIPLVARTATDDEKADLWPRIVAAYRGYDSYQSKTDRDIPVVIAAPASV